ncbi:carbohydrate binding domain-containing protein [Flavobacterium chungnamense]|uniref:T9SS type A sorting domain-containing protein n=1 Tax=Flavobacterium chungnamense TaxID=706182 RepID=A0ABP7UPH6_9FLAO
MKKITLLIALVTCTFGFSQNLITNGNFESGTTGWSGNQAAPGNIVTDSGNSYFSHNVVAAGNPWDANLSYVLNIPTAGVNYKLTFTAWSTANRVLTAGIGLNQDPWTNVNQNVNLTSTQQTFILNFTSNFASPTSRIIFDMGQAMGFVNIDNVILEIVATPPPTLPLIQNFEAPISYIDVVGFEGASAAITTDPAAGASNGNVLQGTQVVGGNPWQGIEFKQTLKKAKLTTNKTMQVDVYASQAFNMLAKVEVGAPASATSQAYTTPGQWQTLTFNFAVPMDGTGAANGEYEKIIFFGNWNATNTGFITPPSNLVFYIDNIRAEEAAITPPPSDPTVAAPTPPARPAADVISLFSDAYSNIGITEWSTSWDDSNVADLSIVGNATKKITFGNFLGVQLAAYQNATDFTHFHMDYYINPGTDLIGKVINPKFSNHAAQAGETSALLLTHLPTTTGSWVSIDVPLTAFGGDQTRGSIYQFLITSNLGILYVDNIYLHKNTVLSNANFEVSTSKMYPNPTKNSFTIEAKGIIQNVSVFNMLGQEVLSINPNDLSATIDLSGFQNSIYLVKTNIDGNVTTSKIIKE